MFTEQRYEAWAPLLQRLFSYPRGTIFRGQRNAGWPLKTSLERITAPGDRLDHERFFEKVFRSSLHRLAGNTGSHSTGTGVASGCPDFETWALMQHHGAPTRLLDWTSSAVVACFFAVIDAAEGSDSAIFVLDRPALEYASAIQLAGQGVQITEYSSIGPEFVAHGHGIHEAIKVGTTPGVVLADPITCSERLWAQQGRFLAPVCLSCSFEENLSGTLKYVTGTVVADKLSLAPSLRREALTALWEMNVSHASLFPGLDGFARSLPHMAIAQAPPTAPLT